MNLAGFKIEMVPLEPQVTVGVKSLITLCPPVVAECV